MAKFTIAPRPKHWETGEEFTWSDHITVYTSPYNGQEFSNDELLTLNREMDALVQKPELQQHLITANSHYITKAHEQYFDDYCDNFDTSNIVFKRDNRLMICKAAPGEGSSFDPLNRIVFIDFSQVGKMDYYVNRDDKKEEARLKGEVYEPEKDPQALTYEVTLGQLLGHEIKHSAHVTSYRSADAYILVKKEILQSQLNEEGKKKADSALEKYSTHINETYEEPLVIGANNQLMGRHANEPHRMNHTAKKATEKTAAATLRTDIETIIYCREPAFPLNVVTQAEIEDEKHHYSVEEIIQKTKDFMKKEGIPDLVRDENAIEKPPAPPGRTIENGKAQTSPSFHR